MLITRFKQKALTLGIVTFLLSCQTAFSANGSKTEVEPYLDVGSYIQRYEAEGEPLMVSVNIWGQVVSPGKYKVPDGTDVVSLISYAGGPTEFASLGNVRLSRLLPSGGENIKVQVEEYLDEPAPGVVPVLKPGDTVYVPKNKKYAWKAFVEMAAQIAIITSTVLLIYTVVEDK